MYKFFTGKKHGVLKSYTPKILLIMRLTTVILIASILQVSATTFAQKVTLKENAITLSKVFKEIEKQTGYSVIYYSKALNSKTVINANFSEASLELVMTKVLSGLPVTYSISKNYVIITEKEKSILDKIINVFADIDVKGKVIDDQGKPLNGATVKLKGTNRIVKTDSEGNFSFPGLAANSVLQISYVGYANREMEVLDENLLTITLIQTSASLDTVSIVSTGYQTLDPQKATGSFVQIDNKLLNRSISTNILQRLDGVTNGLIFHKNVTRLNNQSGITVRGLSTIFANADPLIVVDNFPYNGDISSINPNDVQSITVLKDAASASIWGAFSGNGVIVITTKRGKYNRTPKVEINSNITIGQKPNLYYSPQLSSLNFIDVERYLFKQGQYDFALTSSSFPIVSPVVEILDKRKNGLINSADSTNLIRAYASTDVRKDIAKYLYQKSVKHQSSVSVSGGGENNTYYFSAGYDKNIEDVKRDDFSRISLTGSNTYVFLNKRLELTSNIYYTKSNNENNGISIQTNPYFNLIDINGNASTIPLNYRQGFVDTVGKGKLLDWNYKPLNELNLNDNTSKLTQYRVNTSLKYNIFSGFNASLQYQYDQTNSSQRIINSSESYYTRNLINSYSQLNTSTGSYTMPIPPGGILDINNGTLTSQNARGQINFNHQWNSFHKIAFLGGAEVRDTRSESAGYRSYGYSDLGTVSNIDYSSLFLLTPVGYQDRIPLSPTALQLTTVNRFVSYFSNLSYAFKDRYMLSASARKDQSNIFGVKTNQKGVPLWSAGASWEVNKENFYHLEWLSYLRLRISNGYQGNVDNTLSSLVTATITGRVNSFGRPISVLANPPNPNLRWEKVNTTNFGLDFAIQKFLTGTVEYYLKKGTDLIGTAPVDPTTGVVSFTGNTADMSGRGFDVTLTSANTKGVFSWNTILLFNFTKDKITKYLLPPTNIGASFTSSNPIVGNPLYSLYAYKWAGLDAQGDPQVFLDGKATKDYNTLQASSNFNNIQFVGSLTPKTFGSFRNDFSWKQLSISANITYKFGYYFRRPAINYSQLYSGTANMSDSEYINRWQKSGDENITNVPSMTYPSDPSRDAVYGYSTINTAKGDHIRLRDVSVGYELSKLQFPKLPFQRIRIYGYVNNIGIIWKANNFGIDPDIVPQNGSVVYPDPRTYSLGVKIEL